MPANNFRERMNGKKVMSHMQIEKADKGGGHVATKHFEYRGMGDNEPEKAVFSKDQGNKLMKHIASEMGIDCDMKGDE